MYEFALIFSYKNLTKLIQTQKFYGAYMEACACACAFCNVHVLSH
jgi:hypothetical protein